MGGWRLLILVAVVWLGYWLARRYFAGRKAGAQSKAERAAADDMLRCARCGLHVPRREAVWGTTGLAFCSEGHRAEGGK